MLGILHCLLRIKKAQKLYILFFTGIFPKFDAELIVRTPRIACGLSIGQFPEQAAFVPKNHRIQYTILTHRTVAIRHHQVHIRRICSPGHFRSCNYRYKIYCTTQRRRSHEAGKSYYPCKGCYLDYGRHYCCYNLLRIRLPGCQPA